MNNDTTRYFLNTPYRIAVDMTLLEELPEGAREEFAKLATCDGQILGAAFVDLGAALQAWPTPSAFVGLDEDPEQAWAHSPAYHPSVTALVSPEIDPWQAASHLHRLASWYALRGGALRERAKQLAPEHASRERVDLEALRARHDALDPENMSYGPPRTLDVREPEDRRTLDRWCADDSEQWCEARTV